MVQLMDRGDWIDAGRGGAQANGGRILGVACHWPGTTTNAYGVESAGRVAGRLRGWWDYHVNGRGWSDIGYNQGGDQAARVWDLRGLTRVGAHCASPSNPDANWEWVGYLCILGDEEDPTEGFVESFWWWRQNVLLKAYPNATRVLVHGDVPGAQTSCAGPYVRQMVRDGAPIVPDVPPKPTPTDWEMNMHLSRYGSSQYVLVTDTYKPIRLDKSSYDELAEYGVPVRTLSNAGIQILDRVLPPAPLVDFGHEVMRYKNPAFGEQDVYARIREIQGDAAKAAAGQP